jgi:flavin-dependent dehydrogenase
VTNAVDVLIVGGGPAGCSAALTLLTYTKLRVAVIERSKYQEPRTGETVSHSIQPLLEYLGIWEAFLQQHHLAAYATSAAWGESQIRSRDHMFLALGHGWHLDRLRFDRLFAEQVRLRGGILICGTSAAKIIRETAISFRVVTKDGQEFSTKYLIDASGRRAEVARRLGGQPVVVDHLMGAMVYVDGYDLASEKHETLVESVADGWWYSALLPNGQLSVGFFSDPEILRLHRLAEPGSWTRLLDSAPHTRRRIGAKSSDHPVVFRPCGSQFLESAAGDGWIAAGDAAACFDPLASMGVGHAISSGIHAARAAHDQLCGSGSVRSQYAMHARRNFRRYLELRGYYYGLEQRWPEARFWSGRHNSFRKGSGADDLNPR